MNRSDKIRSFYTRHLEEIRKNRSDTTIVWLENTLSSLTDDNHNRLHSFNDRCYIICYSNILKCIKYWKRARSREYVIAIIVSYPMEIIQRIIHRLQPYRVIQTIFIVYFDTNTNNHLMLKANNLHIFPNHQSMFEILEKRIKEVEEQNLDGGLFTTFCRKEKCLKDVRENMAAFVWTHVFKVILTNIPRDSLEAKRQMLHECRTYYRNDPFQLSQINEFERKYQSKDALRWYTKPGFLFYLVNKALRSQDIWALYKFRYFIMDLSCLLEKISSSRSSSSICVYRGAKLNQDEFEQLQVGCLISTNGFLSCSSDRNVAEMFIGTDHQTNRLSNDNSSTWQQFVLFIIDVDCTISTNTVVADISHESDMPDENEMLFNFGSTFIIKEICFDKEKSIWLIHMNSSSDNAQINQGYEKYIYARLQHIHPIILLGHILANIGGDLGQWMNYFHQLLKKLPMDHAERPNVYYVLGNIYRFIEKFEKALICFRSARLLVRRRLPERMFDYCRVLAGMATIYSYMGNSEKALELFEEATVLQKKSFPDNHTEIPFHLNLMGHGLFKAEQYERALSTLQDAEKFFQEKMPIELQGYAQTLHIMGLVYRALDSDERALICFQEALRRRYSLLGKEHPHLASTYYQLSLLHYDHDQYEIALDYIRKALHIQLIKLPHSHSELKLSKELLLRIQQH